MSRNPVLSLLSSDIRLNINKNVANVLLLLDFSKAFDTIQHHRLLDKLHREFDFSSSAVSLVCNCLSGSTHYEWPHIESYSYSPGLTKRLGPRASNLFVVHKQSSTVFKIHAAPHVC